MLCHLREIARLTGAEACNVGLQDAKSGDVVLSVPRANCFVSCSDGSIEVPEGGSYSLVTHYINAFDFDLPWYMTQVTPRVTKGRNCLFVPDVPRVP